MLVDNGKNPDEPYNDALGFWLPPDSPYGNFQHKYMKIILRLDEANRKIAESHRFWNDCKVEGILPVVAFERHIFANEEVIYMLRRAADELVSLIWCLSIYEKNGKYPNKIKINCLGSVIAQEKKERNEAFVNHIELMETLNNIANAFKHSFINSDHSLLGAEEPCIHALGLSYNKLSSKPEFYNVSLPILIDDFNQFYKSCILWLKTYSEKNR